MKYLRLILLLLFVNKVCAFCIYPTDADPIGNASECNHLATYISQPSYYFKSNAEFYFLPGIHVMESSDLVIKEVNNISLIGKTDFVNGSVYQEAIIQCRGSSGIIFQGTVNLTVTNLTFLDCTVQHEGTNSALVFANVADVVISGVSIQNAFGNGVLVQSASGYFFIDKSSFTNISDTAIYWMNNGVVSSTFDFTSYDIANTAVPRSISITRCSFFRNNASVTIINGTARIYSSSFAGTLIEGIGVRSEYSDVLIYDCMFGKMRTALKMSDNSRTLIRSCAFDSANYGVDEVDSNYTAIEYSNFSNTACAVRTTHNKLLRVHNCKFWENTISLYAKTGLNAIISDSVFDGGQETLTNPFTIGVIATDMVNVSVYSSKFISVSWGVALISTGYCTISRSLFIGNENAGFFQLGEVNITDCFFTNYSNSAITAASTAIALSGNTSFFHGHSLDDGGALYLSNAAVKFVAPANVSFINNSALLKGGAIFAEYLSQPNRIRELNSSRSLNIPCFVQFYDPYGTLENPAIKLYFKNNYAPESGNIMYGLNTECDLGDSFIPNYPDEDALTPSSMLLAVSNLEAIDSREFAVDPYAVCVIDNAQKKCPPFTQGTYNFSLYPGQKKTMSFITIDEYNGTTPSIVYVHLMESNAIVDVFRTRKDKFDYNLPMNQGNATFLFVANAVTRNFLGQTSDVLPVTVQILPCPPGFTLNTTTNVCVCDPFLLIQPGVSCDITDLLIYSPLQSWVGNISDGRLAFYEFCSYELCSETKSVLLSRPDEQCRNNRTGVMCGSCTTNFSEVFGKPQCMKCSNWYLFLIIPFAVMGVALVALLLVINLTVSDGAINGFIFFANVVKLNSSYFLPITVSNAFTSILSTLVAWLNLDFGIVTCFYDGMSIYSKVWLQFVFPIYILGLVGVIVVVGKYSTTVSNLCKYRVVPVLATLVLLSFTKLLGNVIIIFSFATLAIQGEYRSVWQYNGNVAFFSKEHIPLVAIGLFVTFFFIIPYILLMLFSPCLRKVSHLKITSWINTLKPFLDCYEAPFVPKHRYWTGVLLIARTVIYITKALNFSGKDSFNMFITILVVLFLLVYLAQSRAYKSWVISAIEMFLYINLILLSLFRLLFQSTFSSNQQSETALTVTYSLGVGSAVIIFTGIVLYRGYDLIKKLTAAKLPGAYDHNVQSAESPIDGVNYTFMELTPVSNGDETSTASNEDDPKQYRELLLSM